MDVKARSRRWRFVVAFATWGMATAATAEPAAPLMDALRGPFVSDPEVILRLDHLDPGGDCKKSGKLVFACLIQELAEKNDQEAPTGPLSNPLNLRVAKRITKTIQTDLAELAKGDVDGDKDSLDARFFTHPGSRIELVGIINRIDRQFIKDKVPGSEDHDRCGEVSVIYRFYYSLHAGAVQSRLPVTMNVVFPAVPRDKPQNAANCRDIAARWKAELARSGRTVDQTVDDLTNPDFGILSTITGRDIERIELNMQAYRIRASNDETDFGSTAEYVIRVFRWDPTPKQFIVSFLTNQIDRGRLLGNGDANSCKPEPNTPAITKDGFVAYLTQPKVLFDIDTGTLNIDKQYLACRATTVSPGGPHRSKNQPFWNAPTAAQQIISDQQIRAAMTKAETPKQKFSFMKSPDDVRTRLNELSCSGCHQARAIAGFHFPGADRADTKPSNAVLLPGSPHFYGDQPRRIDILNRLANGEILTRYGLAAGYAGRPLNKYKPQIGDDTELLGGWGGACLFPDQLKASQRQWDCKKGLVCAPLFASANAPTVGTCVPENGKQIGDAMQQGRVTTIRYGVDRYMRTDPKPQVPPKWTERSVRRTLIPDGPWSQNPPAGNSYYAAHQEYFVGNDSDDQPIPQLFVNKRDAKTGGFPSGALRLSECKDLPPEATCGLLASSGFNNCLIEVANGTRRLNECFVQRTSYAGVRACDERSPCRDDYICLRPIGYDATNGHAKFEQRATDIAGIQDRRDFGQKEPDAEWLGRNGGKGDSRGLCIPPYFVFQFRSDGHPPPTSP
jgi:hypothetical protein